MLIFEAFEANLVNKVLNLIQILTLNNFGVHGGVTWWTRKMVEVMLTTLITGSPRGLGDDPELKVQSCYGILHKVIKWSYINILPKTLLKRLR